MAKHVCEDCGEGFQTLTKLRLHDCTESDSEEEEETEPEPNTETSPPEPEEKPDVVEMGLEPEYNCPECDYYNTGVSTSPHSFLDHLRDEHGYTSEEAHEVLNG